ncbi:MAG: DUF455 family protein [Gemmatimonadales bacterium]|nr:DUF455 family protein [Gemmatimonadales bacterium]
MTTPCHPALDPALFGEGPARDERFTVKEIWVDMVNLPEDDPEWKMEFFHRQMNEECNVLENAASNIVDFPDADWNIRYWLARQAADEARHVDTYREIVEQRGGHVGQYPVMNFQYRILRRIDTLIGRLAVQNRTFEADGLDAVTHAIDEARRDGDEPLAEMYETQQADEVLHIRFANDWIKEQLKVDPMNVLHMSRALTHGARAFEQVFADGGTDVAKYGVATDARLEAGFSAGEVDVAVEQSDARRAAVRERLGVD